MGPAFSGSVAICLSSPADGLDAPPDREEVTVRAVLANDHQAYGRTRGLQRHSNRAAIDTGFVNPNSLMLPAISAIWASEWVLALRA
jgi:hypothetical protein